MINTLIFLAVILLFVVDLAIILMIVWLFFELGPDLVRKWWGKWTGLLTTKK